jgi:Spy/CpxP family protein refolding chaperone
LPPESCFYECTQTVKVPKILELGLKEGIMKSIRFRLLVAALAVMLGSALAHSQTADTAPAPPRGPGFGMGHEMGFYVKELGITDDQKTQMKAVLQKEHATMKPLMQQMHQLDSQLKQYEEGTYDATKVQALVAAQSQTLIQLKVNEARIHSELYQMLTSDQQAKLKEVQANREAEMQQHMQNESAPAPEQ